MYFQKNKRFWKKLQKKRKVNKKFSEHNDSWRRGKRQTWIWEKKKGDKMRKVWKFLQGDEIWENKEYNGGYMGGKKIKRYKRGWIVEKRKRKEKVKNLQR